MKVPSKLSLLHLHNSQVPSHLKIDQKQVEKLIVRNNELGCRHVNLFVFVTEIQSYLPIPTRLVTGTETNPFRDRNPELRADTDSTGD
jgi:hypothetical protein